MPGASGSPWLVAGPAGTRVPDAALMASGTSCACIWRQKQVCSSFRILINLISVTHLGGMNVHETPTTGSLDLPSEAKKLDNLNV